jgi:hypothetical protein
MMTKGNNESDAREQEGRRHRREELDRLMREADEAHERTQRALIELQVVRELMERR